MLSAVLPVPSSPRTPWDPGPRDLPTYGEVPEGQLRSPAGLRWHSGDWEVVAADFMSAGAERAMRPLSRAMRGDSAKLKPAAAANRILVIEVETLRRMGTSPELRAANPAIAFVEADHIPVVERAAFLATQLPALSTALENRPPDGRRVPRRGQFSRAVDTRRSCEHWLRIGNGWLIVSATFAPIQPRSLDCTASWKCPVSSVRGSRVGPNRPLIPQLPRCVIVACGGRTSARTVRRCGRP